MSHPAPRDYIAHVYEKFWKELYTAAYRRLEERQQAEDIIQDIFLSLLEKDMTAYPEHAVRAYLHTRLRSRIIDHYRKKLSQNLPALAGVTPDVLQQSVAAENSDSMLMVRELELIVGRAVNALPKQTREIFLLSREQLLSNKEIAMRLELSDKTVRNQLSLALKQIQQVVNHYHAGKVDFNLLVTLAVLTLS